MDQQLLVYKMNTLYLGTLSSSLVLILIQGSFAWPTLRSWVCNTNSPAYNNMNMDMEINTPRGWSNISSTNNSRELLVNSSASSILYAESIMGYWITNNFYFSFLLFFWFYIDFLFIFILFFFWIMKRYVTL